MVNSKKLMRNWPNMDIKEINKKNKYFNTKNKQTNKLIINKMKFFSFNYF